MDNFAAFILTNGRPFNVITYNSLRKQGYTGRIVIVIDDLDKCKDDYLAQFQDQVYIFDKKAIARKFDTGDNFNDMRSIVYARNASFEIARKLKIKYFIQLDDDYTNFNYRIYETCKSIRNLDKVFDSLLKFYQATTVATITISQGGDFIGGKKSQNYYKVSQRKAMNSFICSIDRPFKFIGRINEDVNTYTSTASTGLLMFTFNRLCLQQLQSQSNFGGMTELYLDSGTYLKSFYTVMYQPSSVKIKLMQSKHPRLHHSITWDHTVPMILNEAVKKKG